MRLVVLILLVLTAPAYADRVEALKRAGIAAAERNDWATARTKFEQAYALDHEPLTLYNLAAAQEHTNQLVAARASYTKFLVQSDDPRFRKLAQSALAKLDETIPMLRVRLTGAVAGASTELDGAALALDSAVAADPGDHVVVVRRDGKPIVTRKLTLAAKAREEVELAVPLPAAQVREPTAQSSLQDSPPPPSRKSRSVLRSPWLWGIAGAIVVGAGVGYYAIARPEGDPTRGTLGTLGTP